MIQNGKPSSPPARTPRSTDARQVLLGQLVELGSLLEDVLFVVEEGVLVVGRREAGAERRGREGGKGDEEGSAPSTKHAREGKKTHESRLQRSRVNTTQLRRLLDGLHLPTNRDTGISFAEC